MRWAADFWEAGLPINKVTWQQVGHVADPGRYMFRFGWLTIVPDDLAVWKQFPDASFTLVQTLAPPLVAEAAFPPCRSQIASVERHSAQVSSTWRRDKLGSSHLW